MPDEKMINTPKENESLIKKTLKGYIARIAAPLFAAALFCAAFSLSGCKKTNARNPMDTLIIGTAMSVEKASPADTGFDRLSAALSRLAPVRLSDGEFKPSACDFTVGADFKTYTFTPVQGLTWHDGQAVTAEDIKFTVDYYDEQEPETFVLKKNKIESMSVNGGSLEITMKNADVRGLNDFTALRLLPKHIYQGKTLASYGGADANISCGPYKFSSYSAASGTASFRRYDAYAGGKANVGTVIFKLYQNADVMILALQKGDIDAVYDYGGGIDPSYIAALEGKSNITLQTVPTTAIPAILIFNHALAPGGDKAFRKAVASAIDFESARTVLGSQNSVVGNTGILAPGTVGYKDTPKNARDLAAFAQYMSEYGAEKRADGYYYKNDARVSLQISVNNGSAAFIRFSRAAEIVRNSLNAVGIECAFNSLPQAAYFANSGTAENNSPVARAVITSVTAAGADFDYGFATRYLYDGIKHSVQSGRISDPVYDAIVKRLGSAASLHEYAAAGHDVQDYYAANASAVALYYDAQTHAYSSKLSGFTADANFGIINCATWFTVRAD